jgi:drug/metabolite transporter (DMT)-like permease
VAVLLALGSSIAWGVADFLGGLVSRRLPALHVVWASQLAGLLAIVTTTVLASDPGRPGAVVVPAVLAGLAGGAGLVAFYRALAIGPMGVVSPIAALGVVVPVLVGLARGERPSALAFIGMGVAVVGVVAASRPELRGGAGRSPVLLAVGAAAGFGTALVFITDGSQHSPLWTMVEMRVVSVGLIGLTVLVSTRRMPRVRGGRSGGRAPRPSGGPSLPPPLIGRWQGWTGRTAALVATTGVADVAANVALGVASRSAYVSVVGVLGSLYPVVTILLAVAVLRERLAGVQVVGVFATLAGVVLVAAG